MAAAQLELAAISWRKDPNDIRLFASVTHRMNYLNYCMKQVQQELEGFLKGTLDWKAPSGPSTCRQEVGQSEPKGPTVG